MDPNKITLALLVRDWVLERRCDECFSVAWPGLEDVMRYVVITSTKTVEIEGGPFRDFEYVIYASQNTVIVEEHPNIVSQYETADPAMFEKLDKLVRCQCTK